MSAEVKITSANFESEAKDGIMLVDFWAPWCGPCRMQSPIIDKIATQLAGKAKIGKCNTDEEPALASKFGVMSIPTLIIFQKGKEAERLIGLQTETTLLEKVKNLIAK